MFPVDTLLRSESNHRDPRTDAAQGHRAPDAQAALPDVERPHRVAVLPPVGLGGGDHVVDAAADDAPGEAAR